MGFRTVVMLSNDKAHEWSHDPELGGLIMREANSFSVRDSRVFSYGSVVECVHADTQTLAVLDAYYGFNRLDSSHWRRGQSADEIALDLLKRAADKMGYRLSKKPGK